MLRRNFLLLPIIPLLQNKEEYFVLHYLESTYIGLKTAELEKIQKILTKEALKSPWLRTKNVSTLEEMKTWVASPHYYNPVGVPKEALKAIQVKYI